MIIWMSEIAGTRDNVILTHWLPAGVPCGGWCISKAKSDLYGPDTLYTTLSPIPGLRNWLNVALQRPNPRVLKLIGNKVFNNVEKCLLQ